MTDNAFINSNPWLPNDLWATIASFLDNDDLAKFRQLSKVAQFIGSHDVILQPLYNDLYLIDKTLPPLLPQEGALPAFKQAFEKIQAQQQREIAYLTEHHPVLMATAEYTQVFQENKAVSLKSLKAKNKALDKINSAIIEATIDVNSIELNLNAAHITRLPVSLFQAEGYVNFWQNLTHLYCSFNQLTALNVQGLVALQTLFCDNNRLTILDLQGLVALQGLDCSNNQLTALDLQGLVAFQGLECSNNQLTALNVQGLVALQKLWCSNNQLTALNVQGLVALQGLGCANNQLTALDLQGLVALQGLLDCSNNQLTALNVQGLVALQKLWCSNNQLTALNVQGLVALQALYCKYNQLNVLDLQGLVALQGLDCSNNQLTALNVQGLVALQKLWCSNNQLTALNVQGMVALQTLWCKNNPLKTLILTGVHADTKNKYAELERSLLFKKLAQAGSVQARQALIRRLGADYTYKNCLEYCSKYDAARLFASDAANSAYGMVSNTLSRASAFLPSFWSNNTAGNADLKRKREDEMGLDLSEDSDGEREFKRPKNK